MRESTSQLPVFLHGPLIDPEILALVLGRVPRDQDTAPAALAGRRSTRGGDALAAALVSEPGARASGLVLARPTETDRERLGRFAATGTLVEAEVELDGDFLVDALVPEPQAGDGVVGEPWPDEGLAEAERATYLARLREWLDTTARREDTAPDSFTGSDDR